MFPTNSSVPATVEKLFGLPPMTKRDIAANTVLPLLSLATARDDTPTQLQSPATSLASPLLEMAIRPALSYSANTVPSRPRDSVNDGSLPIIIQGAMRQDMQLSEPGDRSKIIARVATLKTRAEASAYLAEVAAKRRSSTRHPLS
jgi:phospholipase C